MKKFIASQSEKGRVTRLHHTCQHIAECLASESGENERFTCNISGATIGQSIEPQNQRKTEQFACSICASIMRNIEDYMERLNDFQTSFCDKICEVCTEGSYQQLRDTIRVGEALVHNAVEINDDTSQDSSFYIAINGISRILRTSWYQANGEVFSSGFLGVECLLYYDISIHSKSL
ncbi:hypothetical protein JTB14_026636 [Gonioctena quinquepunctata]|nr:hypothetical protein JTB14_026636 [Gonioctena quinquepunctata]